MPPRNESRQTLESIASTFHHSFYHKEWHGDEASVRNLTSEEAYAVQDLVTRKRIRSGEVVAGYKVGCTSRAIQAQFGIREPIHGKLFYPHIHQGALRMDWHEYIHCAIEPEMVLKIGKDLRGKDLMDEELIDAIEYVSPGIEMHEYFFWVKPPTLQELICTGGIHTGLLIGHEKVSPTALEFEDEVFAVYKDGSLVTSASAKEIMGGPLYSLRWLVNALTEKGSTLEKGSFVIPGSPVELIPIDRDTELEIAIDRVGSVKAWFEE